MTGPLAQRPGLPRPPFWMRRPRMLEFTTPIVIAATLLVGAVTIPLDGHLVGGYAGLTVSAAGVLLGHRWPGAGLMLLAAAPLLARELGDEPIVMWQVSIFGAFLFTLRGMSGVLCGALVGAANFFAFGLVADSFSLTQPIAWIAATTGVAAAVTGSAIRGQREYWSALQDRTREAVAGRDAAVQRSVAEERLRIARDLHDTLGHEIAVVSMHLGAAEVQLPQTASPARAHLSAARASVKSLLVEVQEILQVLHTSGDGGTVGPVATHRDIPDLVEKIRAAGLEVETVIGDLTRELPPQTSAAAYRITQEALTNAQRYGGGRVRLAVDVAGPVVTIVAVNEMGRLSTGSPGAGRGLIGMRERAVAAGGHLEVSSDRRHFRLRADLPLPEAVLR